MRGAIHSPRVDEKNGGPTKGLAFCGVGYDEPNYFSYVFKRKFGVSLSQYRK